MRHYDLERHIGDYIAAIADVLTNAEATAAIMADVRQYLAAARLAGKIEGLRDAREIALKQCSSYDFRDYQEDALRTECLEIAKAVSARIAEIEKGATDARD